MSLGFPESKATSIQKSLIFQHLTNFRYYYTTSGGLVLVHKAGPFDKSHIHSTILISQGRKWAQRGQWLPIEWQRWDPNPGVLMPCSELHHISLHFTHAPSIVSQFHSSSSEASDNLTGLLRSALKLSKDKLNIENLHLSFHKEDQPFSGHLPPSKVNHVTFRFIDLLQYVFMNRQVVERSIQAVIYSFGSLLGIVCYK